MLTLITSSRGEEGGQFKILDASSRFIDDSAEEEEEEEDEADFFTFGFFAASSKEKG